MDERWIDPMTGNAPGEDPVDGVRDFTGRIVPRDMIDGSPIDEIELHKAQAITHRAVYSGNNDDLTVRELRWKLSGYQAEDMGTSWSRGPSDPFYPTGERW